MFFTRSAALHVLLFAFYISCCSAEETTLATGLETTLETIVETSIENSEETTVRNSEETTVRNSEETTVGNSKKYTEETTYQTTEFTTNLIRSFGRSLVQCHDGPNVGTCMRYNDCVLASGVPFGICPDGLFCCKVYDIFDQTGVAYGKRSPSSDCGRPSKKLVREGKVVGGTKTTFGEFPWQVFVSFTRGRAFCGGTLINKEWVVTAAHCVLGARARNIYVRLGEYDFSHKDEPYASKERSITKKFIHKSFNARGENDIALLKLSSPIDLQPNIIPICLPKSSTSFVTKMGVVTGWGTTSWSGQMSDILLKASLPILSQDECSNLVEGYHSSFLCAGYTNGTADACRGDSGGPLQVREDDGRYYLAGIVSWGDKCAQQGKVGVYTSVPNFSSWIEEHIKTPPS